MINIIIGLVLLMALAYLGWSIIWIAPLVALLVAGLEGTSSSSRWRLHSSIISLSTKK